MLGELWLGLENLHQLTSEASYSLRITMKDFDDKTYVAVYEKFQVIKISLWFLDAIAILEVGIASTELTSLLYSPMDWIV